MESLFRSTAVVFRKLFIWNNMSRYEKASQHKISSFCHIIYIHEGSCILHTLDKETRKENKIFSLAKGDICYIPSGVWYFTETPEGMYNTNIYFSYLTDGQSPENSRESGFTDLQHGINTAPPLLPVPNFADMPLLGEVFAVSDTFGAAADIRKMEREWKARYRYSSELLDRMTAVLLVETVRRREFSESRSSREAADLTTAYIAEHFKEKIDCQSVAKALGYHPNYLNTVIKDTTGMSLHRYIADTKLRHASYLVNNTDMQITEIAAELSYGDASHFTNVYTAEFGISPSKQRKRNSSENI